ncbi:MAG: corrinoid protein [Chloroflexi bacterium]|nr:corrinoid protein [Chloroflexota bacterium]
MVDLDALKQAIIDGEEEQALAITQQAIDRGVPPQEVFDRALIPGMETVGKLMQAGEYFIPEVLFSARTMQACGNLLRPIIVKSGGAKPTGVAVACTVKGDLHDIGKNLVCMMLEGAGFRIVDLGRDCPAEQVAAAVKEHDADLVLLSALLTTTMLNMGQVMASLKEKGLRDRVKVIVGGAPVNARFAEKIGADAYRSDAAAAAEVAKEFVAVGVRAV